MFTKQEIKKYIFKQILNLFFLNDYDRTGWCNVNAFGLHSGGTGLRSRSDRSPDVSAISFHPSTQSRDSISIRARPLPSTGCPLIIHRISNFHKS
jgi:hypothetical protein